MDYLFEDKKQTFEEEISYLFDSEVNDISNEMCKDLDGMGYLFDKEDIKDVLENNEKSITKRYKKTLKNYKKKLQNKGYSNKKIKQLLKKKKKQLKN